tara:strand:- start:180 stop:695 length:516 start_codon:yes stop_codon:yes gene_type:complete
MKKILIIIITLCLTSYSCESPDNSPTVIGFSFNQDGERSDITLEADVTEIWLEYINAHNDRDYEKISNMNSDEIEVWGPAGQYVEGTQAHIEFLKEWIAATDVKWTPQWFINNTGVNAETGKLVNYVTSGHNMTFSINGEETFFYQVHDAVISDGKIVNFNVYEQQRPASE